MRCRGIWGVLLWVVACGGSETSPQSTEIDLDSVRSEMETGDYRTRTPTPPRPRRGHLSAEALGIYDVEGIWPASAGRCEEPRILELMASSEGVATMLLLFLPPEPDSVVGTYRVVTVEDRPEPRTARVGLMLMRGRKGFAFRGIDGEVELTGLDGRVSGRFRVTTVDEPTLAEVLEYAGVFSRIPVGLLSDSECRLNADALVPADSVVADTLAVDSLFQGDKG